MVDITYQHSNGSDTVCLFVFLPWVRKSGNSGFSLLNVTMKHWSVFRLFSTQN